MVDLAVVIGFIVGFLTIFIFIVYKLVSSKASLSKIKNYMKAGQYSLAAEALKKIINKDPYNALAHFYLAECYYNLQQYNLAKSEYNQLFKFDIKDIEEINEEEIRYKLAEIYLRFDQNEEALKELLLIYNKNKKDIETVLKIAELFKNIQKWDHALKFYKKALELDKSNPQAIFSVGEILFKKRQFNLAKKYLQASLKLAPNSVDANYYYGLALKETGDVKSAIIYISKALNDPRFALNANYNLGLIYFKLQDFNSAINHFQKALTLTKDKRGTQALNIMYMIAEAYQNLNKITEAINMWEKIYSIRRDFRDIVIKLSNYQHLKNDDYIKDFLTANNEEFLEICKRIIHYFNCKIVNIELKFNGKFVEAHTIGSPSGWKNLDKLPIHFSIYRDLSKPISKDLISEVLTKMKFMKAAKAYIVAPTYPLPEVEEYAQLRSIEIIAREKLSEILKKL